MGCGAGAGAKAPEHEAPEEAKAHDPKNGNTALRSFDIEKCRAAAAAMPDEVRRSQLNLPSDYPKDRCIGGCKWIYHAKGAFPHPHMSAYKDGFFDKPGPAEGEWRPSFDRLMCLQCFESLRLNKMANTIVEAPLKLMREDSPNQVLVENLSKPEDIEAEIERFKIWQRSKEGICPFCDGVGFRPVNPTNDMSQRQDELLECGCCVQCWTCKGSGTNAMMFETGLKHMEPPELDDDKLCNICFCASRYKMSTECEHYYCTDCIAGSLQAIMDQGQFPPFCPACRAESASGGGANPTKGRIEQSTLTFMARRGVIKRDLCFRFMLQQIVESGDVFFKCPADSCGNWLKHEEPGAVLKIEGEKITREAKVGIAPCGASVCLVCHLEVPRNWEAATCIEQLSVGLYIRTRPEGSQEALDGKIVEVVNDPAGAKVKPIGKNIGPQSHEFPFFCIAQIQVKSLDFLHDCKEDVATSEEQNRAALEATAAAMEALGCRACPHCGAFTQKTWGCNFMKCQKCQGQWCWETGKPRYGPSPPA